MANASEFPRSTATPLPARPLPPPGSLAAWLLAVRLPTLSAAVVPVAVGTGLALRDGYREPLPALAALAGALALQVGANFANDLSDFRRGADTEGRLGPPRAAQLGLLSERQITIGVVASFLAATVAGLYLLLVGGWPIIVIGLASMIAAVTYTGGPWPFGYRGLGEVFVFLFFGLVAVGGTYYVQAGEVTGAVLAAAVPVALTVTAILVVNNVRDIETDRLARKFTLAVLLGRRLARLEFVVTVVGAFLSAVALWVLGPFSPWVLLTLLALPTAARPTVTVLTETDGPRLNQALRATARLHLVFGLFLAAGLAF